MTQKPAGALRYLSDSDRKALARIAVEAEASADRIAAAMIARDLQMIRCGGAGMAGQTLTDVAAAARRKRRAGR